MSNHIEVKIQIIIHSTDDFNKISNALVNLFNLDPLSHHYDDGPNRYRHGVIHSYKAYIYLQDLLN